MPPVLSRLPEDVRSRAIQLPNGEVMWARQDAPAALRAITETGGRVLGLDLRSNGPGPAISTACLATEIPLVAYGSTDAAEALCIALSVLSAVEAEHPEYPWVLVTWDLGGNRRR